MIAISGCNARRLLQARKRQLIDRLWNAAGDAEHRRVSSELVLRLHRIELQLQENGDALLATVFSGPILSPGGGWMPTA